MKPNYLISGIVALCLLVALSVRSHSAPGFFRKHTNVRQTPLKAGAYHLTDEDVAARPGYFPDRERWIVFSERADNITYRNPGSKVQVKTIGFMDPCYVIGRKGDYLELVRYDPKLLQDPHRGAIDIKNADYLGWIHESRLLLWRSALREQQSDFFIKGLICFNGEHAISSLANFTLGDSLALSSGPMHRVPIGGCNMKNLFYIFKQSEDGNQYLVGRMPQVTPENCHEAVSGWISADFVKVWGARSFFTGWNRFVQKPEDKKQATSNSIFHKTAHYSSEATPAPLINPCKSPDLDLLHQIFPWQPGDNGRIKTGSLEDILDRSQHEVLNLNRQKIPFNDLQCLLSRQHQANIILVVDGGSEISLSTAQSVVQQLQPYFDTAGIFAGYRFGAVVYKDNLGRCIPATLSLTSQYSELGRFFDGRVQELNSCNDNQTEQAVSSGLSRAAKLLQPYKDESNIIVLIGAAGNRGRSADLPNVVRQLSYSNTRLLIFQTHSEQGAASRFVTMGKELIEQTAKQNSDRKKDKLVDLNALLKDALFSLISGDSGIYYLDYPRRSITQGCLMFPEKGQIMQPAYLVKGLLGLMLQIHQDNLQMEQSLKRYNASGTRNTGILEPYRPFYKSDTIPPDFAKSAFALGGGPFYIPAWIALNHFNDSTHNLKFGLLVSETEYDEIREVLSKLGGTGNYDHYSRRALYRQLRREIKSYLSLHDKSVDKRISQLSLTELLECMTGYRSVNTAWAGIELRTIKRMGETSSADFEAFQASCREKAAWMTENGQNDAIRIDNNRQLFYWLTAEHLP